VPELYVDGEVIDPAAEDCREIGCPADRSFVASVSEASRADTLKAIAAAGRAFDSGPWPGTAEGERGQVLERVVGLLTRDRRISPTRRTSTRNEHRDCVIGPVAHVRTDESG